MATPTREQIIAGFNTTVVVAETIRTLGSVSSSSLYANLMTHNISYQGYTSILEILTHAKLITVSNHLITWIGPLKGEK